MTFAATWTQEELLSDIQTVKDIPVWRLVEAQHVIATLHIVDSLEEQEILEDIIESIKPPLNPSLKDLPYLLSTPFRYRPVSGGPIDKGSRFRSAGSLDGVFYAAASSEIGAYEVAFYRALFFAESPQTAYPSGAIQLHAFSTKIASDKVLDLTSHPILNKYSDVWENLSDYSFCQRLAYDARRAGIEVIAYRSVRDPNGGKNYAVLTPDAFSSKKIENTETWSCIILENTVFMHRECPSLSLEIPKEKMREDPRFRGIR